MGSQNASNDESIRLAAPAGAAALVAIASVVSLSLANNSRSPSSPTAATGLPPDQQGPGLIGPAQNQAQGRGSPELGVEIVVKFRDDTLVEEITDLFWRDQGAAQARFSSFKRRWDALSSVRLARVTYSNELVLVSAGSASPQEMREIARRIGAMSEVSYAEPNSTAQPGGQ